jgi:hypothetical protein
MYEAVPGGVDPSTHVSAPAVTAYLSSKNRNPGTVHSYATDPAIDPGYGGKRYDRASGEWKEMYWSPYQPGVVAKSFTGITSPLGPGMERYERGHFEGVDENAKFIAPTPEAWEDYSIRQGLRKVGDRLELPEFVAKGFVALVVTQDGFPGLEWTPQTTYIGKMGKLGDVSYRAASVVRPTDRANLNRFSPPDSSFGTSGKRPEDEPDWSTAPNLGEWTAPDSTGRKWKNVGREPVLAKIVLTPYTP